MSGLASYTDWAARKADVRKEAQAGFLSSRGTNTVYMDVAIGGRTEQPMRLSFMLFEQCPLAFANFMELCTQMSLGQSGKPLTYRRCSVYKLVKGEYFEAGDITLDNGKGGDSIYGIEGWEPESFGLGLAHDSAGLLSMVPASDGCSISRFRVSFGPTPSENGRSVIIGRMVGGMSHLTTLEAVPCDVSARPARPMTIVECGIIPEWSNLPPPVAVASKSAASLTSVSENSDALRESVATAVQTAAAAAALSTNGAAKKRVAEESNQIGAPPSKKGGMMALPFEGEMGESDDDDDSDDA